jgi:hypothetical protein
VKKSRIRTRIRIRINVKIRGAMWRLKKKLLRAVDDNNGTVEGL